MVDLAGRVLLHRAYRTVTDSSQGYTSLFNEAALIYLQFYRPVNGYQESQTWLNLADNATIKAEIKNYAASNLKRSALWVFAVLGLLKYVVPDFRIVARKAYK